MTECTWPEGVSLEARRAGFDEVVPGLTLGQAVVEASRCLWCHDAPCVQGCPARVDVPEFVARVRSRDLLGAARVIYRENPLGAICGRVCPVEALCEKACTTRLLGTPVAIGRLQRFVCDSALAGGKMEFSYPPPGRARVAVVGSGPAGLSCAHFLRLKGYHVTVYEGEPALGGLLRWGIPAYRLPQVTCQQELALLAKGLGWESTAVSAPMAQELLRQFEAVFLATGLARSAELGIPGEDSPGVMPARQVLRDVALGKDSRPLFDGKDVAVIGCGATAMDSARTALRLGARNALVVYRRTQADMPGFVSEFHAAQDEGVQFLWLTAPASIATRDERLLVTFHRMRVADVDADGRHAVVRSGERFDLLLDILLEAVGQCAPATVLDEWPELRDALEGSGNVFIGGDLAGSGTVVQAVADGKQAARRIDARLDNVLPVRG